MTEDATLRVIDDGGLRTDAVPLPIAPHDDPEAALAISLQAPALAIPFPSSGDGRGFSVAKALRAAGYRGRLRAVGALIPDQYAHARACGFDEVAGTPDHVARTCETAWSDAAKTPAPPFARRRAARS
jgi:uncharacterized protein (DUF934 family)